MKIKSKAFKSIGKLAKKKLTVAKKLVAPGALAKLLKKQGAGKLIGPIMKKLPKTPGLLGNEKFLGVIRDLVRNSKNLPELKKIAEGIGSRQPRIGIPEFSRPSGSSSARPASDFRIGIPEFSRPTGSSSARPASDFRIGIPEFSRPTGSTSARPASDFDSGVVLKDPLVLLIAAMQAQLQRAAQSP